MNNKRIYQLFICICLAFIVVVSALAKSSTQAKYISTVSGNSLASVASVAMEQNRISFNTSDLKPGGSASYAFTVTNVSSGIVSDVAQSYTITVNDLGNLPLIYTLQCTSTGENGIGIYTAKTALTAGTASAAGVLPHTTETTHTYTLTASWPTDSTNPALADEIDLITLTVDSIQLD